MATIEDTMTNMLGTHKVQAKFTGIIKPDSVIPIAKSVSNSLRDMLRSDVNTLIKCGYPVQFQYWYKTANMVYRDYLVITTDDRYALKNSVPVITQYGIMYMQGNDTDFQRLRGMLGFYSYLHVTEVEAGYTHYDDIIHSVAELKKDYPEKTFKQITAIKGTRIAKLDLYATKKHAPTLYNQLGQLWALIQYMDNEDITLELSVEHADFFNYDAEYYYHENSCWHSSYMLGALDFQYSANTYAVRYFIENELVGRSWLYGTADNGIVFNTYSDKLPRDTIYNAISQWLKLPVAGNHEYNVRRKFTGRMYLNGDFATYGNYCELPELDEQSDYTCCYSCEEIVHTDYAYNLHGEDYCVNCVSNYTCDCCGNVDDSVDYYREHGENLCDSCRDDYESAQDEE